MVQSEGGDGADHVEVPAVARCAGFFGGGDGPLPAPEVRVTQVASKTRLIREKGVLRLRELTSGLRYK